MSYEVIKVHVEDPQLRKTLELLSQDLHIQLSEEGHLLNYIQKDQLIVTVETTDNDITITAPDLPHFYAGLAQVVMRQQNRQPLNFELDYHFERNGIMLDCSRNGVVNVATVKKFIRQSVVMGHTWLMLYIEDVYEIPGEAYFGAFRGRYSQANLKELDAYAIQFGLELFPAIQTLAHVNQFLMWEHEMHRYGDIDDIFNVKREATLQLVEKMIASLSECFTSNRIHLGMDEAYNLGRGTFLDENGLQDKTQIMLDYLDQLVVICDKYQVQPLMWDDMFFSHYSKFSNGQQVKIPETIDLMYWDYYHTTQEHYEEKIDQRREIAKETSFAGGSWRWTGYVPHHIKTLRTTIPALNAAKAKQVKRVITTAWGDDGSEAPFETALFGLTLFAYLDVNNTYDEALFDQWLQFYTNQNLTTWLKQGELDFPLGQDEAVFLDANPSKYLLYQDLLLPVFMPYIESLAFDYGQHLIEIATYFEENQSTTSLLPDFYAVYARTLAERWDLPLKIWELYHQQDKASLRELIVNRIRPNIDSLRLLLQKRRAIWLAENNPMGLEIIEQRFGGVIMRAEMIIERLNAYIDNEIEVIEELEEKRLDPLAWHYQAKEIPQAVSYIRTERIMSRSRYSW
ncbi:beta-N-acetylhexosaminidase [Fundicoccus culcitae]|uniref:Beta-N-acetylhexosaminidase n=1 Tax=Fundicoccus culcitae TaxID=2969821 RepID=A0ABY5P7E4_9LACT|nr:beta-N-acetylhexosaminidase [Fundicoccus culcitae]UUX34454.1 beta-N-acetylhexosaminidase [Fundicoccus culcitae]